MRVHYRACGANEQHYKDTCGAKLLPTIVSAYPVDCVCFCDLLKIRHCCLSSNERYNSPPAAHPPPPPPTHPPPLCPTHDIPVAVKKVAQNPAVLTS